MTERAPINHAALRAARAAAGVTASDLARTVGCGKASIYDYESGRVRPPALLVPALARALRVTIASLSASSIHAASDSASRRKG